MFDTRNHPLTYSSNLPLALPLGLSLRVNRYRQLSTRLGHCVIRPLQQFTIIRVYAQEEFRMSEEERRRKKEIGRKDKGVRLFSMNLSLVHSVQLENMIKWYSISLYGTSLSALLTFYCKRDSSYPRVETCRKFLNIEKVTPCLRTNTFPMHARVATTRQTSINKVNSL